ncbi:MAG: carboxymuconolactone decarboxylase family protein [Proteobacteria bacterium]|nr:carboxymuconolactone decarboxylase family protein [Pseudomonadota bacterium]
MSKFNVHTKETAQAKSAELLGNAEKAFGFVPNLLGVFAESPAALKGYLTIGQIFDESSFSPTERQVVILAASRFNECHYCVAAHSVIADLQKVPTDVVKAIRNDQPIADSKLEALRSFTTAVVEQRGCVSDDDIAAFLAAGYSKAQILEVILGISFKTLSNYANHIADTPLDDAFAPKAWAPVEKRLAS